MFLRVSQIGGRTIKSSIAVDNGRSTEFIRRRDYLDKSKCYECGEEGHLSYSCQQNTLGKRNPPPKKHRKRKTKTQDIDTNNHYDNDDSNSDEEMKNPNTKESDSQGIELETLSSAIQHEVGIFHHKCF